MLQVKKVHKVRRLLGIAFLAAVGTVFFLSGFGITAQAAGLVDDTVDAANLYSRYPLYNYQLDFYVDNDWGWLPWNWLDGIGKSVQYAVYCITNFIWILSLYVSKATGYVVQEAYSLDFITDMSESIGKSIQAIAGVSESGLSADGFYGGLLLMLVVLVGIYAIYTGMIKRAVTRAASALFHFVVVFVLSASFIAYAPDFVTMVNEFSSDIATEALEVGTKIIVPDSDVQGRDSVDLIRDSLFSIQVYQPWLLLQYGTTDVESIGQDRIDGLVSVSPDLNDGEDREAVVKDEIENHDNNNLTIPQVVNRLGMVFFLLFFNIGISLFVFLLTALMIFSQVLFIIFSMFLPVSFLISMVPGCENVFKQAIIRVFNVILMRAGYTLVITVAFSISSMFYSISPGYPFFMIAFLQVLTCGGILSGLGGIMRIFSLGGGEQMGSLGQQVYRRGYNSVRRGMRRLRRGMRRAGSGGMSGIKKAYRAWQNLGSDARAQRRAEYGRGMDKGTGQWQRGQAGAASRAATAAGSGSKADGTSAQRRKGASHENGSESSHYAASASGVYANSRGLLDEVYSEHGKHGEDQDKKNLKDKGIAKRRMAMQQNGSLRRLDRGQEKTVPAMASGHTKASPSGMVNGRYRTSRYAPAVASVKKPDPGNGQGGSGHMQRPPVTGRNLNGSMQRPSAAVKGQEAGRQRPSAAVKGQEAGRQRPPVSGKVQNHYAQQIVRSDRPFVNRKVIRRMAPSDLVDIKQVRVKQGAFKAAHTAGREFLKMDKKDTMDWVLNGGKTAGKDKNRR